MARIAAIGLGSAAVATGVAVAATIAVGVAVAVAITVGVAVAVAIAVAVALAVLVGVAVGIGMVAGNWAIGVKTDLPTLSISFATGVASGSSIAGNWIPAMFFSPVKSPATAAPAT